MSETSHAIYLGRQPIVDRNQQLVAFELLFRDGPRNAARIRDDGLATATVVTHAFSEMGLADALGKLNAYVNVDAKFLFDESIEILPPEQTVLEILETVVVTPEIVERCRDLRSLGFRIAIDDIVGEDDPRQALYDLADVLKVDVLALPPEALPRTVDKLRATRARLLAEKVDQPALFQTCLGLGFDLFQGYHFARPSVITGRKLDNSKVVLLRLMTQVMEDADTHKLEETFKQAPGLTINLLRLVNSVAGGLSIRISSLRHAITVLGRRQLQRWLQLLLYTDPTGVARLDNPLLQLAATRGRLMELLADGVARGDSQFADHAFVCGVMSLTPALLDQSLDQILKQVNLAAVIADALRDRKGRLGQLLALVEAMELESTADVSERLLALPMLHADTLSAALAAALRWANHIGEEAPED